MAWQSFGTGQVLSPTDWDRLQQSLAAQAQGQPGNDYDREAFIVGGIIGRLTAVVDELVSVVNSQAQRLAELERRP